MNRRILATLFSMLSIIGGTVLAIKYAQGYRPTTKGDIKATGLLAVNSFPNGASVYLDGNLTTATDTTLNLDPGSYTVEIKKDGYSPWKKTLQIEKELVAQTNAVLFPIAPSLTPLTFTGAENLTPSPDGQQLIYMTASSSASKNNGLYLMNLSDSPIGLQRSPTQIAQNTSGIDLRHATILWSPESTQLLVSSANRTWLLATSKLTDLDSASDVSTKKTEILSEWRETVAKKEQASLHLFPAAIAQIATQSARYYVIAPDQDRILYEASASAQIADTLMAKVPAANTQSQHRAIETGKIYVYDRHEDKNFLVGEADVTTAPTPSPKIVNKKSKAVAQAVTYSFSRAPQWLPDSKHLIFATQSGIEMSEYDGTNRTRVYAGPFAQSFVYPWPNGSKLMILTNFNEPDSGMLNLYAVGIK